VFTTDIAKKIILDKYYIAYIQEDVYNRHAV